MFPQPVALLRIACREYGSGGVAMARAAVPIDGGRTGKLRATRHLAGISGSFCGGRLLTRFFRPGLPLCLRGVIP